MLLKFKYLSTYILYKYKYFFLIKIINSENDICVEIKKPMGLNVISISFNF